MTRLFALTFGLCAMCVLALAASSRAQEASTPPPPQAITADLQDAKPPAQPKPAARAEKEQKEKEGAEAAAQKSIPPPRTLEPTGPNVRIEVTLTEQQGTTPATSKTVVLTTSNEQWGKLRTTAFRAGMGSAPLNVDARPVVLKDGRISVSLTVEYAPDARTSAAAQTRTDQGVTVGVTENGSAFALSGGQTRLDQSLTLILQNGQPLLVTQSADAISDRKVTVEVKATVLR